MFASRLYLTTQAIQSLANSIMFTSYAVYYVQGLSLTPLQLVLVGTAVEVAVLLFELPTGVVADAYGRRRSVIIGTSVMSAAYLLEGGVPFWSRSLPFFWAVVCAEIIRGIGWTFISGAEEAWITDEVGTDQVGALHLQAGQIGRAMQLLGIPVSVLLANVALYLPYLTGGLLFAAVALLQLLRMRETAFVPRPRSGQSPWAGMQATLAEGIRSVRGRPLLLALLAVSAVAGAASEGVDRLGEAHFLITFRLADRFALTPVTIFGILHAAGSLLSIGAAALGRRYLDLKTERRMAATLLTTAALRVGGLLLFALAGGFWSALAGNMVYHVLGALYRPIYQAFLNRQIDSRVRATVLSLMGQADALGQSGGGPVVGWVGTRFSLRAAIALSACLLAPLLGIFGRVAGRGGYARP